MMEAGVGLDLDPEVRATVERAAGAFASAGAIVEPMPAFITRTMLDGLDLFWRQRAGRYRPPAGRRARAHSLSCPGPKGDARSRVRRSTRACTR